MRAEPGLWSGRLALGWLIGGEWRFHPARFLVTALAIAVGVALGFAVHLVNGSALASFDSAVRGVNGSADLSVKATSRLGFDERLYPRVASATGVMDASPVVQLDARIGTARVTLLGLDILRAAAVTPTLIGVGAQAANGVGGDVFDEASVFLSRTALERSGARLGALVTVEANGRAVPLRVAGTLPGVADGSAVAVIDIAAAQWKFDRIGRLDRLDAADRGRADDHVDGDVGDPPAGVRVQTCEHQAPGRDTRLVLSSPGRTGTGELEPHMVAEITRGCLLERLLRGIQIGGAGRGQIQVFRRP